jgi:hypothetical protein
MGILDYALDHGSVEKAFFFVEALRRNVFCFIQGEWQETFFKISRKAGHNTLLLPKPLDKSMYPHYTKSPAFVADCFKHTSP